MVRTLNSRFSPFSFRFFLLSCSVLTLCSTSYSVCDSLRKP
jgi:hypothetical protein